MFDLFRLWCGAIVRTFRCRRGLMLENLALRQQLAVLKRIHPRPNWFRSTNSSGSWHSDAGPDGKKHSFSFCQKRWSAGTELDSVVLGDAVQRAKTSRRWPANLQTDPRANLPNGRGESRLGCAPHSR